MARFMVFVNELRAAADALEKLDGVSGERKQPKRVLSPAAKKRISDAQVKRWAAFRKKNKAA